MKSEYLAFQLEFVNLIYSRVVLELNLIGVRGNLNQIDY